MKTPCGPVRVALITIIAFCAPFLAKGQTNLYFETLFSYDCNTVAGAFDAESSGLHGKYLNFRFDGQICEGLTVSYRQRLNKPTTENFFDATDWIHLDWKVTPKICLSAGKQVVAIGGFEYDRAPIDLYYCSEFWNNVPCYQIGGSASFDVSEKDKLLVQLCNSPMRGWAGNQKYALNLMWCGSHGSWDTIWSANAIQCISGNIYYLALGNRFNFTDRLRLDVDLMDRYTPQTGVLDDVSVMTELSGMATSSVRVYGKYTFDSHKMSSAYSEDFAFRDYLVRPGTDLNMVSAGVEYHPLRSASDFVKLFAAGGYSWGNNSNPNGIMADKGLCLQAGLKFRLDVLRSLPFTKE